MTRYRVALKGHTDPPQLWLLRANGQVVMVTSYAPRNEEEARKARALLVKAAEEDLARRKR